jgi:hypothetical protein
MPLGVHMNDMRRTHTKFHEFSMHRNVDVNLSLFSFPEFCTLDEHELMRFDYRKDVVLDGTVLIKFTPYF